MANIYRKAGTKNWYCNYADAAGRRVHRSTGERKRSDAMRQALEWESECNAITSEQDKDQQSILRILQEGAELSRRGALTPDAGRRLLSRMMQKRTGEELSSFTAEGWLNEWLSGKDGSVSRSTYVAYSGAIRRFVKSLGSTGSKGIDHVTEKHVRRYRDQERKRGKAAKSCNLHVKMLSMAFETALNQGIIPRNPCKALPRLLEDDSIEKEGFELREVKALLRVAPIDWQGMILLGLYGGLRIRDAANLTWECVDLDQRLLKYCPNKNKRQQRTVVLPLHRRLGDYLLNLPSADDGQAFIFPDLAGRGTGGAHGLSVTFKEIMVDAKVDSKNVDQSRVGAGRRVSKRSFHSLRHSATSIMANKGVPEELRMKLVGHSTRTSHANYTHHEIATLRDAVEQMPGL